MACGCSNELKQQIKLVNIIKHNSEVYSFDFENIFPLTWEAGDHSKIFLNVEGQLVGKKFSYATLPSEGVVKFTTRIKENRSLYKEAFSQLKVGEMIEITMPKGHFQLYREDRPIVLLSNGVGIAAVRSIVKAFEFDATGIPEMIQINVDASGKVYCEEFEALQFQNKGFKSHYFQHRKAFYSHVDFELQKIMANYSVEPLIYVVGSDAFVIDLIQYLKGMGFTDDEIVTDGKFSAGGGCGCSSGAGCGCGANELGFVGELVAFG